MSLHEGPVVGTCPQCGYRTVPLLPLSPCGHNVQPLEANFDAIGEVYSWTRVWSGGSHSLMAMADFFDGTLRVTAPVRDAETIDIGSRVRAEAGTETPIAFTVVET